MSPAYIAIPALGRPSQEDYQEFEAIGGYTVELQVIQS